MKRPSTSTFVEAIDRLAALGDEAGFVFIDDMGQERFIGWTSLVAEVKLRGRRLAAAGLERGDRVALIIPAADDFILTFLGAVASGIVPVPLYPPLALAKLDTYIESTARVLEAADVELLVTTTQVEKVLWSVMGKVPRIRDLITVEKLARTEPAPEVAVDVGPHDPVFLQFTSGSTAAPKGVIVTHASLIANGLAIMFDGLDVEPHDKGVSWLPLYHDMGLIGHVLAPMLTATPVVFIPTIQFVKRPTLWMDAIHKHRGTLSFAPNFAFARVTKRATEADLARWDLSCVKALGCGAEPIHAGTMRAFLDKFAGSGLKPTSLLPCYGMAEATLAMSFIGTDDVLKTDQPEPGLELVSCGKPFPGHELGIFDSETHKRLPEGKVGEIRFRGPSVAGGYFRNPEATRATFLADGWLRTGDLGYQKDGELYISGREKDLLIIHGRNYYPQAIEWQIEHMEGIRKGNVVAFSVPGADTEEVVIVAETSEIDPEKRKTLAHKVKSHLNHTMSIVAQDVVLLGVGQLPKTTSGKLQRRKTREQYLARTLGTEGVRIMGSTGERLTLARHFVKSLAARVGHRASSFWPWWPMTLMTRRGKPEERGN